MMDLSLIGKRALVCGSTQGIGLAIAKEFSEWGADCTLLARNQQSLEEAVKVLDRQKGQQHGYIVADFNDPDNLSEIVGNYVNSLPVQILVNNTGGPPGGPITEAEPEAFLRAFQQHLICNHLLTRHVVPSMKAAGYGRIINIISTSVKIPIKNLGVSNTIRGAVASWAKTMANELGIHNITVNNILPGFIETGRLESLVKQMSVAQKKSVEEIKANLSSEIPMGRTGSPAEIAAMAAFLASPAASYVNGTSIPVDGGRTGSI